MVWRVQDTAQALFDVENYTSYLTIQSESALRHLASSYSYDHGDGSDENEVNLRSGGNVVAQALQAELKRILELAARASDEDAARDLAEKISAALAGRSHPDSTALVREDRDR